MIPHILQLKNFLSYGPEEQTITFTPHHLICLSGKNGHGKSALLDAITWSIWGQARKTVGTSKADDGLMHLGQKYMFVRLDFEVNGQLYRVRREYIKTKSKPMTILDFGILKDEDSISPLTDKTIKLTQTKIEKTIGLTYESFANSAFLKQGESNAFSKKTPRERKEILATILHLDQFESLKKSAVEKARIIQQQYQNHLYVQEKIHEELTALENVKNDAKNVDQQLQEIEKQEQKLAQKIETTQKKSVELEKKKQKKSFLEEEYKKINIQIKKLEDTITTSQKLLAEKNNSEKQKTLKQLEQEKEKYKKLIIDSHALAQEEIKQKETYFSLKESIQKKKHQEAVALEQTKQVEQITSNYKKEQQSIIKEIEQITKEIAHLKKEQATIEIKLKELAGLENLHQEQTQKYTFLYAQGAGAKHHIEEIEKQMKAFTKSHDSCLLCEQFLDKNQQQKVRHYFEQQKKESQEKLEVTKQTIAHIQQELKSITTKKSEAQEIQNQKEKISFKLTEYTKQESALREKQQGIKELIDEKQEKNKNNDQSKNQYQKEEAQLASLEKKIQELQDKQKSDQNYQEQLSKIESDIKQYHESQAQTLKYEQIRQEIKQHEAATKTAQKQANSMQKELESHQHLKKDELEIQKDKSSCNEEYQSIQKAKTALLTQKGSLKTKQERQKALNKDKIHYEEIILKLQREIDDYQAIGKALGKDGIQALLIEEALPEIEQEANLLLSKLTNNQTQIFIESLRDLKKGGNKETLDIKIADNMGIRPYEMFSGGEAFRIDFALRIAISKLVARHAGTSLQTIFIDEGFGSQDEEGLQLIMDCIYKIQNDFAKVIIVSHLPALKEQFPVQFLIKKKPSGTQVTIVEHG